MITGIVVHEGLQLVFVLLILAMVIGTMYFLQKYTG